MAESTEAQDIIDITLTSAEPKALTVGQYWVVRAGDEVHEIDLTSDEFRGFPRRITGTATLADVASLLGYWGKHATAGSDMFADPGAHHFCAVIDAHGGGDGVGDADWQQHRAACGLVLSDAMAAWKARDGQAMKQDQFAEFIDENMTYIVDPPAADLLEMVQQFEATTTAVFKSGVRVQSGQRTISYVENIDATMGGNQRGGTIEVPRSIALRLPVWRNMATVVDVTAALRFRVVSDKLTLSYKLVQLTDVIDGAFAAVVDQVAEGIGRAVLLGTPMR
jgi:Uncharacterized conserved protein